MKRGPGKTHQLSTCKNGANLSVDQCTTTYLDTKVVISSYTTITAPTSTEVNTELVTTTSTM